MPINRRWRVCVKRKKSARGRCWKSSMPSRNWWILKLLASEPKGISWSPPINSCRPLDDLRRLISPCRYRSMTKRRTRVRSSVNSGVLRCTAKKAMAAIRPRRDHDGPPHRPIDIQKPVPVWLQPGRRQSNNARLQQYDNSAEHGQ